MGHYCRICGSVRPNERFSGKGHRTHVCKDCARKPKTERNTIDQEQEIFGYLKQSHISPGNMARLRNLSISDDMHTAELAALVLEVGTVRPFRKRRLRGLARERRDLIDALERRGLIDADY